MYLCSSFFFFNDTATTEIYTLSLHDALPIFLGARVDPRPPLRVVDERRVGGDELAVDGLDLRRLDAGPVRALLRSEEHTSELQSRQYLVCRLLLEKKKNKK